MIKKMLAFSVAMLMIPSIWMSAAENEGNASDTNEIIPVTDSADKPADGEGYILASPSVVYPESELVFTVWAKGEKALAMTLTLEYPSAVMSYKGYENLVSGFEMSVTQREGADGKAYLDVFAISSDLNTAIDGVSEILKLRFVTSKDASDGQEYYLTSTDGCFSDGLTDKAIPTLAYKGAITTSYNGECDIESLRINGKTPEGFSADTVQYSMNVEYAVTALELEIVCKEGCTYTVRGNTDLAVGENRVIIEVRSARGMTQTYTIKVTRSADPNHVISDDATLSGVLLSNGFLSPELAPDKYDYMIYMSESETTLVITPTPSDKAAIAAPQTVELDPSKKTQTVEIVVTAESGKICKYVFTVLRLPEYEGKIPYVGEDNTGSVTVERESGFVLPLPEGVAEFLEEHGIRGEIFLVVLLVLLVLVILLALVLLIGRKRRKRKKKIPEIYIEQGSETDKSLDLKNENTPNEDDYSDVF